MDEDEADEAELGEEMTWLATLLMESMISMDEVGCEIGAGVAVLVDVLSWDLSFVVLRVVSLREVEHASF